MSILRFAASFSILAFLSLFVQANLFQVDFTSGTFGATYLYAAMLSFIVAIVSAGDIASFFKLKKSIFVLVTFLCYTFAKYHLCLLYTSPSPRDRQKSRMPSSA